MAQAVKTYSDDSVNGAADQTITTLSGLPSIPAGATLNSVVLSFTCDRTGGRDDNEIRVRLGSTIHYYIQDLGRNDSRTCDITGIVRNNGGTLTYSDGSTSLNLYAYHAFKLFDNANWKLTNIKITANYTAQCTVTVNVSPEGGGTVEGAGTYTAGTQATVTAKPNNGYNFVGWTNSSGEVTVTTNPYTFTVNSNTTFGALFEAGTFYVYFSGYGATSGIDTAPITKTVTYGQSYTLPTPGTTFHKQVTISWNGNADDATLSFTERTPLCYCIGWKRDPNTSTMYQPGESVNIEPTTEGGNVTFYATWGATSTDNPIATRPGYRLKEWNTKADGSGTAYTGDTIETSDDITLYAQWEKSTCTITVQSNNTAYGTVTGGGTYENGSTATLTATPKTGYKFVKWNDGYTSATRTFTVVADATYIAIFEGITYYVAFDGNYAESGSVATITAKYGENFTLPENGFVKKVHASWYGNADDATLGYRASTHKLEFNGWKFGLNASYVYSPGEKIANMSTTDGATVPCYADWSDTQFEHPTATRPGYKFKEWNTKADGSGTPYTDETFWTSGDVADRAYETFLYAQWEKLPPEFVSVTITRSTDLAKVTIDTPVEAGAKYIISVEVT